MDTFRRAAFASNRSFGWAATGVCALFGAWSAWTDGYAFAAWFTLAAVIAALTMFAEDSLDSARRASSKAAAELAPYVARAGDAVVAYLRKPRSRRRRA